MPNALETIRLVDPARSIEAHLAPSRGGILTRLSVRGRELLYLDEATLLDETKNVRGGCPVLFPSPGPLTGDRFARDGRTGAMKQHGLARQLPWAIAHLGPGEATLELRSTSETLSQYPWPFRIAYHYALEARGIRITQRFESTSEAPMPFACGFHPYFRVASADKARTRIPTPATRAWDNVGKREVPVAGEIDLTAREVDLHLVDHGGSEARLLLDGGASIVVRGSSPFARWVIWTLEGKDFVCLEPWTAASDALNHGAGLLSVPGRSALELWTSITLE